MKRRFNPHFIFFPLFLFGFIGLLSLVTLNDFDFLDPLGKAINDFTLDDIVFSKIRKDTVQGGNPTIIDERVVLINIGYLDRKSIAEEIEIVNKYNPKVVGLDVFFRSPKGEDQDSSLEIALSKTHNLVMVTKLNNYNKTKDQFDTVETSYSGFMTVAKKGYGNLVTEGDDEEVTCRSFSPIRKVKNELELAFAVRVVQMYDRGAAHQFSYRNNDEEFINYRRNIRGGTGGYYTFDYDDLKSGEGLDLLTDKIVIFGFLGNKLNPKDIEDKFYTPMNRQYVGRAFADMYGAVIHANIISMILDKDYINPTPTWVSWVVAIVFCLFNTILFSYLLHNNNTWYGASTKLIQVIEILLIATFTVYALHFLRIKIDLTLTTIIVALIGDLLEIYYSVIVRFFEKVNPWKSKI